MWFSGTSLLVQWLRLCAPNAEGPGLIPGQGTGSHNAETNAYPLQLTIPRAIQLRPLQLNKLKEKKRLLLSLQSDSYSSQSVLSSCYLSFCFVDYAKAFDCVDHNKLWKILKKMGIPDYLTCLLRNLYAGQETTVRTGHGTTDWFQIGKGVRQG